MRLTEPLGATRERAASLDLPTGAAGAACAPGWRRRENWAAGSLIALSHAWICWTSPFIRVWQPRPAFAARPVAPSAAYMPAMELRDIVRLRQTRGTAWRGARRWQLVAAPAATAAAAERLLPPRLWLRLRLRSSSSLATALQLQLPRRCVFWHHVRLLH